MTTAILPSLFPMATSLWKTWSTLLVARYEQLYLMPTTNVYDVILQSNKFHSKTEMIVKLLNELMPPSASSSQLSSDSMTGE